MKALAITSEGIEDIASLEIKELINAKSQVKKGCVIFDVKKIEDILLFCYKSQSVNKVLYLLDIFSFKTDLYDKISNSIRKMGLNKWLTKGKSFRVSCKVINSDISSEELNGKVGELIVNKYNQKVDLDNPDVVFFVYIFGNNCYLGIDFSGFNLHKRSYKIFNHPNSLRGTIAYALVRIAGFKKKEILLDPFMGSGIIPIEAALFCSGFPVNYFNKEKFAFLKLKTAYKKFFGKEQIDLKKLNIIGYDSAWLAVNSAKKNAKIAGINKILSLSRLEVEWLDTKYDKETVDKIVTHPPEISRNVNPKDIEKLYNEFFYQAEFVLKKKGLIVLISRRTDELKKAAEKYRFKLKEERDVYSGKEVLKVLVFEG